MVSVGAAIVAYLSVGSATDSLVHLVCLWLGRAARLLRLGLLARSGECDFFFADLWLPALRVVHRDPLGVTAGIAIGWKLRIICFARILVE